MKQNCVDNSIYCTALKKQKNKKKTKKKKTKQKKKKKKRTQKKKKRVHFFSNQNLFMFSILPFF